jgi:H+/gluconate symporter-like permease
MDTILLGISMLMAQTTLPMFPPPPPPPVDDLAQCRAIVTLASLIGIASLIGLIFVTAWGIEKLDKWYIEECKRK